MKTFRISKLDYPTILSVVSEPYRDHICLDFSSLEFVQSDGLVLLTLFLHSELVTDQHIEMVLPEIKRDEPCPLTYMKRMHFFDKVNNLTFSGYDASKLNELGNIQEHHSPIFTPLLDPMGNFAIGENGDNLDTLIDSFVSFLRVHYGLTTSLIRHLKQLITETLSNLFEHSQPDGSSLPYYCSQIQHYPKRQGFRLAIGDLGVGIRNSLNTIHSFETDINALTAVVEDGISRMRDQNEERGGGIRQIFRIAKILELGCRLRSGSGVINIDPQADIEAYRSAWFPGTQLFVWK